MKFFILAILSLGLLAVPLVAVASPAALGGKFADAYTAFAPVYALYRSYADYLFSGTPVAIPAGLTSTCQTFSRRLASLQVALVTEKGGNTEEALTYLVHVQQATESFCTAYHTTLQAIVAMSGPDMAFLDKAAKAGFFAAISDINDLMGRAFDRTLTGLPNDAARWKFSVAFATRTLLDKPDITRVDSSLSKILLGSAEAPPPPPGLPTRITAAIRELASYSGKTLTTDAATRVKALARAIYQYLIQMP